MEKEITIKTPDGKLLYGTFAQAKEKAENLVIFVHGFTGNRNEHHIFNGVKFLTNKGFDTFRFNLYGEGKDARHFNDTKISLHGQDITTVTKYFRKEYKKIFVIGHSYGGTSLLFTDQTLADGLIFWDASYVDSANWKEDLTFNKHLNAHILDWGIQYIVGQAYIEELKNFPDCGELIKKINKPVLFITAGAKGASESGKKYLSLANEPKKLVNIEGANHCFDNFEHEEKLINETYNWLRNI